MPLVVLQFYFPKGPPASEEAYNECLNLVHQIFSGHDDGLPLSGMFSTIAFKRQDSVFSYHSSTLSSESFVKGSTEFMFACCLLTPAFMPVTKEICKLPSFFTSVLFKKLDVNNTGLVTKSVFAHPFNVDVRLCDSSKISHQSLFLFMAIIKIEVLSALHGSLFTEYASWSTSNESSV